MLIELRQGPLFRTRITTCCCSLSQAEAAAAHGPAHEMVLTRHEAEMAEVTLKAISRLARMLNTGGP